MFQKRTPYRNKKILQAAKGEECLAQFPGCTGGGEDTCFRHLNESWAGKGTGQKADDIAGFISCQHCENLYAGLNPQMSAEDWLEWAQNSYWYICRAMYRTIRRLLDKGVLK